MENKMKCVRCKVMLSKENYKIKRNGNYQKTCNHCLQKVQEYRIKNLERLKCPHNKRISQCKECGGGSFCEHNRERTVCKECDGGQICEHKRRRRNCKECCGVGICEHNRMMTHCKICNPTGHLTNIVRSRINRSLKCNKSEHSIEYLGCNIKDFKEHIGNQLLEQDIFTNKPLMTWDNYGSVWHIDHIIPIQYENPTIEEVIKRLHWTNTQPMYADENMSKGNRYIK